jgi:sRNA-binding regulator protein Hfq
MVNIQLAKARLPPPFKRKIKKEKNKIKIYYINLFLKKI